MDDFMILWLLLEIERYVLTSIWLLAICFLLAC